MYFSILNNVKIKITHNIVPVNLHSSINVSGMSLCPSDSPNLLYLGQRIFRNITAMANSAKGLSYHTSW